MHNIQPDDTVRPKNPKNPQNPQNPQNLQPGDIIRPTGAGWGPNELGQLFEVTRIDEDGRARFGSHDWIARNNEDWAVEVVERARTVDERARLSAAPTTFAVEVDAVLDQLGNLLKAKNAAYGNSALDPVRVFSTASPSEQLRVRLDDKLSRLARGSAAGEDVILDLMGYLVLLRIAESRA